MTHSADEFQRTYEAGQPPNIITLDVVMPDKDGIEVVRWLAERQCPSRVIIISGFNPSFAKAARIIGEETAGMKITQLQKPVRLGELRAALSAGMES